MKKVLLTLLIAGCLSGAAMAQQESIPQPPQQEAKSEWENKVKTELNLTPDQATKYDEVCREFDAKMSAIKEDGTMSEADKAKKMELKEQKFAKLSEFLTPEQQAKYKELMEKKKAQKSKG